MGRVRVTSLSSVKCTEWPQITWHVQGQYPNMHATYMPEAQIFVRFALRWTVFELCPLFGKVHQMTLNDLIMFKVKNTPRPRFSSFPLYDELFLSYSPIFGKVHIMISRSEVHIWILHTSPILHFCLFCSTMSRFRANWDFWIPNWLQCKNLIITNS